MSTPFHAKYFAHALTLQHPKSDGIHGLSMALFNATVDLNPHQIDAALFALRSPLSQGVILADEVGLGKTIEAGLVLCQYWAERKRKLLIICPASLRKQWSLELSEKFNLPSIILDSQAFKKQQKAGNLEPFKTAKVVITSFNYASRMRASIRNVNYDLVVIDEAHKLRNAYKAKNKTGQNLKWALEGKRKCLLTATPLQNSLLELYGLSIIIDERIFGDVSSFRAQYTSSSSGDLEDLRDRIQTFCKRTLRRQVVEYIRYTKRRPLTIKFSPNDDEQELYEVVSEFLSREDTLSVPVQQRHLMTLILRKLLASSSHAILNTLVGMRERLEKMLDEEVGESTSQQQEADIEEVIDDFFTTLLSEEELGTEYLDAAPSDSDNEESDEYRQTENIQESARVQRIKNEIKELSHYIECATQIGTDTKSKSLLSAFEQGFDEMEAMGAQRKALVFTESRRTQDYLKQFLEANGYEGQIVLFNGTNSDPDSRRVINEWIKEHKGTGRVTGSRQVDSRTALIDYFRESASIMIATEAAAEGVNMQFCSLLVNYDMPWNPQRIEQRIGRCHRYGQKHDVVVINFLNERNEADCRVYELLDQKFSLFNGVFGASDEVLGQIESGVDFERRILKIYQQCRSVDEINKAFTKLQQEMDEAICSKMADTRQVLMEYFDEDVHARLKVQLDNAKRSMDRFSQWFWGLSRYVLADNAHFSDAELGFELYNSPTNEAHNGQYRMISKEHANTAGEYLYRLSHPLGEWAIERAKAEETLTAKVSFDTSNYHAKISIVENQYGRSGWLILQLLTIDAFDREEYLIFSAVDTFGNPIPQETCQKFFQCDGTVSEAPLNPPEDLLKKLKDGLQKSFKETVAKSIETNNQLFEEERERLEKWAEDMVLTAEKELADTKSQLKILNRQARQMEDLEEKRALQTKTRELERKQRKQRQQIFTVEDEIAEKRDQLLDNLESRMQQKTSSQTLFCIQWSVV